MSDIAGDLARGYAVIVPARPPDVEGGTAIAWWRVDADAGETLGMMPGGGSSSAEGIILQIHSLAMRDAALFFVDTIIGMVAAAGCIIGSDVRNSEAPAGMRFAHLVACVSAGVMTGIGASQDRRMAIAIALIALFVATTLSNG